MTNANASRTPKNQTGGGAFKAGRSVAAVALSAGLALSPVTGAVQVAQAAEVSAASQDANAGIALADASHSAQIDAHGGTVTMKDLGEKYGIKSGTTVRFTLTGEGLKEPEILEGMYSPYAALPKVTLASGTYQVKLETYKLFGGWSTTFEGGSLTVNRYYDVTFKVSGADEGGVLIGGAEAGQTVRAYDGSLEFSVKTLDDYATTVKLGDEVCTPSEDGVYTVSGLTEDGVISVEYAAVKHATVTADKSKIENATVSINGKELDASTEVPAGESFTVAVKPENGYALLTDPLVYTDLLVYKNSAEDALTGVQWTYANGVATATILAGADDNFKIEARATQTKLATQDATVGYLPTMSTDDLTSAILKAIYNQDASVPSTIDASDLKVEYLAGDLGVFGGEQWKSLDYRPTLGIALHAFGANGSGSTEKVRLTYAGTGRIPAMSADATVTLADPRSATSIVLANDVSVTYNASVDAMNEELFKHLDLLADGSSIKGQTSISDFTFSWDRQAAGTQTVTITYAGNDTQYQGSTLTATVSVEKAVATVTVNSKTVTYGDDLGTLVSVDPADAKAVSVIAGVEADGDVYASVDLGGVTLNDVAGTNIPSVNIPGIGTVGGNTPLQNVLPKSFTLKELPQILEALEKWGIDPGGLVTQVNQVIDAIEKVAPGALNATIQIGGTPTEAGLYTVGAITVSGNYKTTVGLGGLTINKKSAVITLKFNSELDGSLTMDDARAFDFGAQAYENDKPLSVELKPWFMGMTSAGKLYASSEAPTEPGTYTQSVSTLGSNYFAEPILRLFTIEKAETTVEFVDGSDKATYDGKPHSIKAVAKDAVGNPLSGEFEYMYAGFTAAGDYYYSFEAPTQAGTYTVTAIYLGDDDHKTATATHEFTIAPNADAVTIKIGNATTEYGTPLDLDKVSVEVCDASGNLYAGMPEADLKAILAAGVYCEGDHDEVGSHAMTVDIPASVAANYANLLVAAGTHTVKPRAVEVSVPSFTKTYGEADPDFANEISLGDNSVTVADLGELTAVREAGEGVGTYPITVACSNPNYTLVLTSNPKLTIEKRTLTVAPVAGQGKVEGAADPELALTFDGALDADKEAVAASLKLTRESGEKPGTYAYQLVVENTDGLMSNYQVDFAGGTFKIVMKAADLTPAEPVEPAEPSEPVTPEEPETPAEQPDKTEAPAKVPNAGDPSGLAVGVTAATGAVATALGALVRRRKK